MIEQKMNLKTFQNTRVSKRLGRLSLQQEALIRERVTCLPKSERLVVYLHFWENSSWTEIAEALGIPITLVLKLFRNALLRLENELQSLVPHSKPVGQIGQMEVAA